MANKSILSAERLLAEFTVVSTFAAVNSSFVASQIMAPIKVLMTTIDFTTEELQSVRVMNTHMSL
jgi:hypothetical protein